MVTRSRRPTASRWALSPRASPVAHTRSTTAGRWLRSRSAPPGRSPDSSPGSRRVHRRGASRGVGRRRLAVRRAVEHRAHAGAARRRLRHGRILAVAGASGQPVWLTLRQLVRDPPQWREADAGAGAHLREPVVVALAADRSGRAARRSSAPTVSRVPPRWCCCARSRPPALAWAITATSTGAGSRSATSCTAGCRSSHGSSTATPTCARWPHSRLSALTGRPSASWDPALSEAMREAGRRIEEELVAAELLEELPEERARGLPHGDRRGQRSHANTYLDASYSAPRCA